MSPTLEHAMPISFAICAYVMPDSLRSEIIFDQSDLSMGANVEHLVTHVNGVPC